MPGHVLVFAPDPTVMTWVEEEMAPHGLMVQSAPTLAEVVATLIDGAPPRPQILVADFDEMSASEVLHLHDIRDKGWFGSLIGVGVVSEELQSSLNIARVLVAFRPGVLRQAIDEVGLNRPTTRMPSVQRPKKR